MALPLLVVSVQVAAIEEEDFRNVLRNSPNAEIGDEFRPQLVLKVASKISSSPVWPRSFLSSPFRSRDQRKVFT